MEYRCVVLLIILLSGDSLRSEAKSVKEPANVVGYEWGSWTPCSSAKDCQWERYNTCSQSIAPHITCRDGYWREQYRSCRKCEQPGIWYLKSFSSCEGDTCENRVKTRTYACSDHIKQPGCEKIHTQFCNQAKECDGKWSTWENFTPCIKSSVHFVQIRKRFCVKLNLSSLNCAKTAKIDQTQVVSCNPSNQPQINWPGATSSIASTQQTVSTTTTKQQPGTTTTKQQPASTTSIQQTASTKQQPASTTIQQTVSTTKKPLESTETKQQTTFKSTTEKNKLPLSTTEMNKFNIPEAKLNNRSKQLAITTLQTPTTKQEVVEPQILDNSSVIKEYVFVIQSIFIVLLLGIILYLACYIKRRKKKKKRLSFEVATNQTDPSTTYNQFRFPNSTQASEYEHMLPRAHMYRASCPNLQRPLPVTPSQMRPTKPPRRHRPVSEIHATFSRAHTHSKRRLTLPATSSTCHSAPVSPTSRESVYKNTYTGTRSLQRGDDLDEYVKPFN